MQPEFTLEQPDAEHYRDGREVPLPPAPGGRPKGSKNKLHRADPIWKMARNWTPVIMDQVCRRAARCEDEIDFRCAQLVLSRTWAKPRSVPLTTIDITQINNPQTLLAAMAQGELTPADAATLVRAIDAIPGHAVNSELAPRSDARERVARKLAGIVAARIAAAGTGAESAGPSVDARPQVESGDGTVDDDDIAELLGELDA